MPKYRVKISEVVTYNVELEAATMEEAKADAIATLEQAENTDQYLWGVDGREVEGAWELENTEPVEEEEERCAYCGEPQVIAEQNAVQWQCASCSSWQDWHEPDTSDLPEVPKEWFDTARLVRPGEPLNPKGKPK